MSKLATNEYRAGNIITFPNENRTFILNFHDLNRVHEGDMIIKGIDLRKYDHIFFNILKLTEIDVNTFRFQNNFGLKYLDGLGYQLFYIDSNHKKVFFPKYLKYVHEAQNIHFYLTGVELF